MLATVDMTGLNELLTNLQDAMVGTGRSGDLATIVSDEARKLALEITSQLTPTTKEKGVDSAARDLKRVFAPGPAVAFEQSKRKPAHMDTDVTWLYAGPNFLAGARDEDIQPQMDLGAMEKLLGDERRAGFTRGRAQINKGRRGKQSVLLLNRVLVARERFQRLLKKISGRIGRMRATMAYAAWRLGAKRIPSWIRAHFESVAADGRAIFDDSELSNAEHPAIVFGSAAPGIDKFEPVIASSVERRKQMITARIHHLFRLYGEDVAAGRRVRRHEKDTRTENERMFDAA